MCNYYIVQNYLYVINNKVEVKGMKILIAMDSFKESMTSEEACTAVRNGVLRVFKDADCILVPLADGGEGTSQILASYKKAKRYNKIVTGPVDKVDAHYYIVEDEKTCIMEMASPSGLDLLERKDRNPLYTTTYGLGELILDAMDHNINKLIIGVGGSATNDGGVGMLMALGGKFINKDGKSIGLGGKELTKIHSVDISNIDKRIYEIDIEVICDVDNLLLGEKGATYVYGPQKGGTKEILDVLEYGLQHYSNIVLRDINIDLTTIIGGGAAGGLGAALMGILNAKRRNGIDFVIEYTGLKEIIQEVDLVITGEGGINNQNLHGKVSFNIGRLAKSYDKSVILFAGKVDKDIDDIYNYVDATFSIVQGVESLEEALENGRENLTRTVENVMRIVKTIDLKTMEK